MINAGREPHCFYTNAKSTIPVSESRSGSEPFWLISLGSLQYSLPECCPYSAGCCVFPVCYAASQAHLLRLRCLKTNHLIRRRHLYFRLSGVCLLVPVTPKKYRNRLLLSRLEHETSMIKFYIYLFPLFLHGRLQ